MKELPVSIIEKIDRYQPVTVRGLTLHPVRVRDARLFSLARPALEFAQQSLPVALLSVPLLDAFWKMEQAAIAETGTSTGLLTGALLSLSLALRLVDGKEGENPLSGVLPIPEQARPDTLKEIQFKTADGLIRVTPRTFQKIRPILAAQNGAETPSETANPEILEMERLMTAQETSGLDPKLYDKIIFAAQGCGVSEEEIYDWPLLKLERNAAVLVRKTDYLAVQLAAMSGMVKFKDGCPVPSPYFAKRKSGLASMRELDSAGSGADAAVRNKQNQPENTN